MFTIDLYELSIFLQGVALECIIHLYNKYIKEKLDMKKQRFLLASDIHWCHIDWYGVKTKDRMERFIRNIEEEYRREPFETLLFLGDYSLDHWQWDVKGSWITKGVSNTKNFVDFISPRLKKLGVKFAMIAGNHEQFGEETWQRLTGFSRVDYVENNGCLFLLLDTFGANLDPIEHSDGTYCGVDVAFIEETLSKYPNDKVILCAHYFDIEKESQEFKKLIREKEQILCLCSGHVHKSNVVQLNEEWGNKVLLFTGQYSYSAENNPLDSMWGFREFIVSNDGWESKYIVPENTVCLDGVEVRKKRSYQDGYQSFFP